MWDVSDIWVHVKSETLAWFGGVLEEASLVLRSVQRLAVTKLTENEGQSDMGAYAGDSSVAYFASCLQVDIVTYHDVGTGSYRLLISLFSLCL